MLRSTTPIILALGAAVLITACAPARADDSSEPPDQARYVLDVGPNVVHGDGPGISVAEALARVDSLVLVNGSLFVDADGVVLLCDAIAESYPPQCGGDRIEVVGLGLSDFELKEASSVRWAEQIQVAGTVRSR